MALAKTDIGQTAFKQRSNLFTVRQRSAFILFDGQKTALQVLAATSGLGLTQSDVDQMVAHGFLKENTADLSLAVTLPSVASPAVTTNARSGPEVSASASPALTNQQRYAQAWPLATQLTASLGMRGFRLNLSVEAAGGYDDLLALFPKIQAAVGADKAAGLERTLTG
jgi:hypothetical protein